MGTVIIRFSVFGYLFSVKNNEKNQEVVGFISIRNRYKIVLTLLLPEMPSGGRVQKL